MSVKNIPLISIGLPVFNGESRIKNAIDDLLMQTYPNVEIIISDNASSDGTAEICRSYAEKYSVIRYIRHEKNLGAWQNFSFVLSEAKGEYFMWAAHDDRRSSNWIKRLSESMGDGIVMAYGDIAGVDESGREIGKLKDFSYRGWGRLLKFYFAVPWKGKANLIYGLFRTNRVKEYPFNRTILPLDGFDMHFLFWALQYGDFVYAPDAVLKKLVPTISVNTGRNIEQVLSSIFLYRLWPYMEGYFYIPYKKKILCLVFISLMPVKFAKLFISNLIIKILARA